MDITTIALISFPLLAAAGLYLTGRRIHTRRHQTINHIPGRICATCKNLGNQRICNRCSDEKNRWAAQ